MKRNLSLLLGAGFSAPKGYPVGGNLNDKLKCFPRDSVWFSPDGKLIELNGQEKPQCIINQYETKYNFCIDLIEKYCSIHDPFDYELFYDYLQTEAFEDERVRKISAPYEQGLTNFPTLLKGASDIYNELINYLLKDSNGINRYDKDDIINANDYYPGYTGFLHYITQLDPLTTVHIHTLNHDLLFESFNNTLFFTKEKICDGFSEIGSKYYANVNVKGKTYLCRVERYVGRYTTRYRLYKLHGSINYYRYYRHNKYDAPDAYLKHIYHMEKYFYKECRNEKGILSYVQSFKDLRPDFLTGTTTKILRYGEPRLYKKLFRKFQNNLQTSDTLIIIGYGAKDDKINEIIKSNFDYLHKRVYIVDPQAGVNVENFAKSIHAQIIRKGLENIMRQDFE